MRPTSTTAPIAQRALLAVGVVCILAMPSVLTAQQAWDQEAWEGFDGPRVEGRVVDAVSGDPLGSVGVRVLTSDGERVLGSGYSDRRGRYRLVILLDSGEDPGPVVVESGRLGYRVSVSEPFELDLDGIVRRPDLELYPDPVMLDTLEVERRRHWSYIPPPRERVLARQLQGKGVFLAGASISAAEESTISHAIANRVEGLDYIVSGGLGRIRATMGRRCLVVLVNEWPGGSIDGLRVEHIGAIEVYREYDEIPEELRHHILNRPGSLPPPLCGLINIWLWDSWNRGIDVEPEG